MKYLDYFHNFAVKYRRNDEKGIILLADSFFDALPELSACSRLWYSGLWQAAKIAGQVEGTEQLKEAPIIEPQRNKQICRLRLSLAVKRLVSTIPSSIAMPIGRHRPWLLSSTWMVSTAFNQRLFNSINTTVQYVNYQLLLPNDDVKFKVSGNYVVKVYNEDDRARWCLPPVFSIYGATSHDWRHGQQQHGYRSEQDTPGRSVSASTIVDIDSPTFGRIENPRLAKPQRDNVVSNVQPSSILPDPVGLCQQSQSHLQRWRWIPEIWVLSHKYNGMNVDHISFHNPYYHVELYKDINRSKQTYQYDQDQDGRYFPACSSCNNAGTEADYYVVHFASMLPTNWTVLFFWMGILLLTNQLTEENEMDYNRNHQAIREVYLLEAGIITINIFSSRMVVQPVKQPLSRVIFIRRKMNTALCLSSADWLALWPSYWNFCRT